MILCYTQRSFSYPVIINEAFAGSAWEQNRYRNLRQTLCREKPVMSTMKHGQILLLSLILTEWIACVHAASMLGELVKHKMYLSTWEKTFISMQTLPHFYSRLKKFEGSWYGFPGILRLGYIFDTQHKLLTTLHFCLLYWCLYFPLETESHFKSLAALIE